jgi:TRAP-type C4-dicarboxylate transport system permease small subunit
MGLVMTCVGAYLLTNQVVVAGSYWSFYGGNTFGITLIPMLFVLIITLWSLIKLMLANAAIAKGLDVAFMNAVASAALTLLALYLVVSAIRKLRGERRSSLTPEMSRAS